MISITKVVRFEAAHVIEGYPGACGAVHGHSYELHVTVRPVPEPQGYIGGIGLIYDFKDLKKLLNDEVLKLLDHRLLVSEKYSQASSKLYRADEVLVLQAEPTAENILIFINERLKRVLPGHIRLTSMRLWETRDSYAEIVNPE